MSRFGIGAKLLIFSVVIFMGYAFLAGLASHKIHQTISAERVEMVRHLDETAVSMVKSAYARVQSGEMTEEAAKKMVKDQLRIMRWGTGEYYYVHDYDGTNIVHGGKPEREGQNFYNFVDPNGRQIIKEQIESARNGTGAVIALSPVGRAGSTDPVTKLSYAIAFDPWHWAISTSTFVDDIEASFAQVAWQFFSIAVVVGLFMVACAWWLSRKITKPLGRLVQFTEQPMSEAPTSEFTRDLRPSAAGL
jgi:methyl-accepting chemotaxis protein